MAYTKPTSKTRKSHGKKPDVLWKPWHCTKQVPVFSQEHTSIISCEKPPSWCLRNVHLVGAWMPALCAITTLRQEHGLPAKPTALIQLPSAKKPSQKTKLTTIFLCFSQRYANRQDAITLLLTNEITWKYMNYNYWDSKWQHVLINDQGFLLHNCEQLIQHLLDWQVSFRIEIWSWETWTSSLVVKSLLDFSVEPNPEIARFPCQVFEVRNNLWFCASDDESTFKIKCQSLEAREKVWSCQCWHNLQVTIDVALSMNLHAVSKTQIAGPLSKAIFCVSSLKDLQGRGRRLRRRPF